MAKTKYSKKAIVALCAIVYFTSYFSRKSFAAALNAMIAAEHLPADKILGGQIGTALFICYGVGQLISGFLGDRVKPAYLLASGLGVSAVCNLLMPFMPANSPWMILIWGVNGLAQAMLWPPIVRILSDHLDYEHYVRANLIVTIAAHVSTFILYIYTAFCIKVMSWKAVFFTATVLALVVMVVFLIAISRVLPDKPNAAPKAKKNEAKKGEHALGAVLLATGVIPLLGSIIACGVLRDGLEEWLPTLYSESFGRPAEEATALASVLPVFALLTITLVTVLHRKRFFNNEARGSMVIFLLAAVLCLPIALLIALNLPSAKYSALGIPALVLTAVVCASMHGVNFLLISCLPGRFARFGRASTVGGLVNAFVYIGSAAATYGIPVLENATNWAVTVLILAVVAVLGILLALIAYRKYTAFIKETN